MKRVCIPVLLLAAAVTTAPDCPQACIHAPARFTAYVDSGAQRGLVFFDNGREELVIQPAYTVNTTELKPDQFTDDGLLKNFNAFAWLVPLPSLPDSYAEVEPKVFDDLAGFTEVVSRIPEPERGPDEAKIYTDDDKVEFLEALEVGAYTIQPLKATGEAGGKELASWLKDNGFGELDERVSRFYVEGGFYWLAIKLSAPAGLPEEASAKPLRISFKTTRPVYPLKIYDKRGELDLELWLVTRDSVDLTKSKVFGLQTAEQISDNGQQKNRETSYIRLPESVRAVADASPDLKDLRAGKVFIYRLFGHNLDAEDGLDLALLQDDLHFEFEKHAAARPKEEVKPTPAEEKKEEPKKD